MQVIKDEGSLPIKAWTDEIEDSALAQLKNLARMLDRRSRCDEMS